MRKRKIRIRKRRWLEEKGGFVLDKVVFFLDSRRSSYVKIWGLRCFR